MPPGSKDDELDLDSQIDALAQALEFDEPLDLDDASLDLVELEAEPADLTEELEVDPDLELQPDAQPSGGASLFIEFDGRTYEVDRDRFIVGRVAKSCDLTIVDANISRKHCAIVRHEGTYFVQDFGSTNGVEVDGQRVTQHEIRDGDVLVLSGHRLNCSFSRRAARPAPAVEQVVVPAEPAAPAVTRKLRPLAKAGTVGSPEPDSEPPIGDFETRVEQRLIDIASHLSQLQRTVDQLGSDLDALKVEALASLIKTRLRKAKPNLP